MTRPASVRKVGFRKWAGTFTIVAVVSGAMIVSPLLEHPVQAQQSWEPQPQGWGPPAPGAPAYGYAPPPVDAARAAMEATQDAQADENGALWFFAGCLLGVIGVVIAYVAEPTPPPARLMGKSPEYLAIYMQTYRSEGRRPSSAPPFVGMGTVIVRRALRGLDHRDPEERASHDDLLTPQVGRAIDRWEHGQRLLSSPRPCVGGRSWRAGRAGGVAVGELRLEDDRRAGDRHRVGRRQLHPGRRGLRGGQDAHVVQEMRL